MPGKAEDSKCQQGYLMKSALLCHLPKKSLKPRQCSSSFNHHENGGKTLNSEDVSEHQNFRMNSSQSTSNILSSNNIYSSSPQAVHPLISTCKSSYCETNSNVDDIEFDLYLVGSEMKEFNDDFYHLCKIGPTFNFDSAFQDIPENVNNFQKPTGNICLKETAFSANNEKRLQDMEKETTIRKDRSNLKPIRPLTLSFCDTLKPTNIHQAEKKGFGESLPKQQSFEFPINKTEDVKRHNNVSNKIPRLMKLTYNEKHSSPQKLKPPLSRNTLITHPGISCTSTPNKSSKNNSTANSTCSYKLMQSLPADRRLDYSIPYERNARARKQLNIGPERQRHKNNVSQKKRQTAINVCAIDSNCTENVNRRNVVSGVHDQMCNKTLNDSKEGCGTAWIHLQTNENLSDPEARASLLKTMVTAVSSSGSSSEDDAEENDLPLVQSNTYLQKLCKEKRRKIKALRLNNCVQLSPQYRSTVINQPSLYYRFGEREREAIACFDFLEDIPTSSSEPGSLEHFNKRSPAEVDANKKRKHCNKEDINAMPPYELRTSDRDFHFSQPINFTSRLRSPILWNKPIKQNVSSSTLNSQEYEFLDHISLSDSCAESYNSTPDSFDDACS